MKRFVLLFCLLFLSQKGTADWGIGIQNPNSLYQEFFKGFKRYYERLREDRIVLESQNERVFIKYFTLPSYNEFKVTLDSQLNSDHTRLNETLFFSFNAVPAGRIEFSYKGHHLEKSDPKKVLAFDLEYPKDADEFEVIGHGFDFLLKFKNQSLENDVQKTVGKITFYKRNQIYLESVTNGSTTTNTYARLKHERDYGDFWVPGEDEKRLQATDGPSGTRFYGTFMKKPLTPIVFFEVYQSHFEEPFKSNASEIIGFFAYNLGWPRL